MKVYTVRILDTVFADIGDTRRGDTRRGGCSSRGSLCPLCRICNPTLIIIRICNPF